MAEIGGEMAEIGGQMAENAGMRFFRASLKFQFFGFEMAEIPGEAANFETSAACCLPACSRV